VFFVRWLVAKRLLALQFVRAFCSAGQSTFLIVLPLVQAVGDSTTPAALKSDPGNLIVLEGSETNVARLI